MKEEEEKVLVQLLILTIQSSVSGRPFVVAVVINVVVVIIVVAVVINVVVVIIVVAVVINVWFVLNLWLLSTIRALPT